VDLKHKRFYISLRKRGCSYNALFLLGFLTLGFLIFQKIEYTNMNSTTHNLSDRIGSLRFDYNPKSIKITPHLCIKPEYISVVLQSGIADDTRNDHAESSITESTEAGFLTSANDAATAVSSSYVSPFNLAKYLTSGGTDGVDAMRSVKEFLATPYPYSSGTFTNADTASTFPNIDVCLPLMNTTHFIEKLKGFHSIRFDTVLNLEFNGNPFQTGRYILAFCPTGGPSSATSFIQTHRFCKTQITQLPHVQFDINCDTRAKLIIPFISCHNSVKIKASNVPYGSPGVFFLYPYQALGSTAGSTSAAWTLWVSYENVTLYNSAVPQMGRNKRGRDIISDEVAAPGPIGKALSLIADTSLVLSGIPMLSSIAGPVSWVTQAMAKAANVFGWSKPILLEPPMRVVREVIPYLGVSDGKSVAAPMGLIANNHVDVAPGFAGTDLDELSIDFIKMIPAYYGVNDWKTDDAVGTVISQGYVHPGGYSYGLVDGITSVIIHTPLSILSEMFNLYRGGMRLHFKIVKTGFHSGRLMLTYSGQEPEGAAAIYGTIATSVYSHKTIIDIRDGNEFTIQLPFASTTNFKSCDSALADISGTWSLVVLDPLVAPATVSTTIKVILEVSGSPELTFAHPYVPSLAPYIPVALQSGLRPDCELLATNVGASSNDTVSPHVYESLSTGEPCTSLRQLLKRGGYINYTIGPSTTNDFIFPFLTQYMLGTAGAPTGTPLTDPYNLISSFYCLSRGSMRITAMSATTPSSCGMNVVNLQYLTSAQTALATAITVAGGLSASQAFYDGKGFSQMIGNMQVGGWSAQVPQYTQGHSRAVSSNYYYTGSPVTPVDPGTDRSYISVRNFATSLNACYYHRAGGDDLNLGGFVSIPPFWGTTRP